MILKRVKAMQPDSESNKKVNRNKMTMPEPGTPGAAVGTPRSRGAVAGTGSARQTPRRRSKVGTPNGEATPRTNKPVANGNDRTINPPQQRLDIRSYFRSAVVTTEVDSPATRFLKR